MQVGMVLVVRQHFANLEFSYQLDGQQYDEIASGGDFLGVSETNLMIYALAGVIFLVIAYLAWRGRPSRIRFVLMAAVVFLAAFYAFQAVQTLISVPDLQNGIDAADSAMYTQSRLELVLYALVVLYVIWYINRGPARAFFRGYYLDDPQTPPSSS